TRSVCLLFFLPRRPPCPTLFPYTTLFRSSRIDHHLVVRERLGPLHLIEAVQRRILRDPRGGDHERHVVTGLPRKPLPDAVVVGRSEEHTSELQSRENLVCRLLLEKKKSCQ